MEKAVLRIPQTAEHEVGMANLEKKISKKIAKAIFQYKMIEENDRLLVAVSGGKDSMTMAYYLNEKKRSFPIRYDFKAIHIKTDFCNCSKKNRMETILEQWGVPYEIVRVPVLKRLKPGKKMNCYWCSTQRRMELLKYANQHGFNKIVLGHHLDDILETFFMNMAYKSELSTMLPKLKYDHFLQTIIRPLTFVKEKEIISFADKQGISRLVCACPYGQKSKRKDVRKIIDLLADGEDFVRENIFKAMSNPNQKYLPVAVEGSSAMVPLPGCE